MPKSKMRPFQAHFEVGQIKPSLTHAHQDLDDIPEHEGNG
jgi:hypothetical protein